MSSCKPSASFHPFLTVVPGFPFVLCRSTCVGNLTCLPMNRPSLSQAAVIRLVISRVSTALPPTEESPAAAAGPRYQRGRGRGQLESRMPPFRASGEACGRKANQGTHQDAAAPNSSPGVSDASRTKVNGHSCKGQSSDIDQRSRAQTRDDTYDRAVPKATRAQGPPDSGAGARAAECSGAEDASDGGGNGTAASIGQANKAASTPANRVLPGDIPFERAGVGPGGRSGPQRENLGGDDAQCGPADNAVGDGEAFPTCQQATGPGVSDLSMGRKPSGMGGIVEEVGRCLMVIASGGVRGESVLPAVLPLPADGHRPRPDQASM